MSKKTTELAVAAVEDEPKFAVSAFFNGLNIPSATKFDLFKHKRADKYLLHGENDTLDYNAQTAAENEENNEYVVALYDPRSKAVELFKAPLMYGQVTARNSRVHKGPKIKSLGVQNYLQRTALGQAFGTKKAKAALVNLERNRIDTEGLLAMEMDIVDNVKLLTVDLPTRVALADSAEAARPTPPANVEATLVENIYSLDSVIPDNEWESIRIQPLIDAADELQRSELLPFSTSTYLNGLATKFAGAGLSEKVGLVYYASLLLGVYHNRRVRDKNTLMEKLGNKPADVLVDGVVSRFAVARTTNFGKAKDRLFAIDPFHEDKLLCYLIVLLLHIEDFTVDVVPLSHELNMKPSRLVLLLRVVGTTVKPMPVGRAEALGISKKEATAHKIAVLRVPFKLPELTRRGRK